MGEDCPEKSAHDKSHSECRAKLAAPAPQPASSDIPKERIRPPGSTQRSCNSLFPCTMCRPNLSFARTLTTNVRSRAESDHGLQEVPRMEKEPMWRAVYASAVRVPKRACGRVWRIKPSGEQAHTQGNECLYRSDRWTSTNLGKRCVSRFAGRLDVGCVCTTSAIDLRMLW